MLDMDEDGIPDDVDNCPEVYNPLQIDSDGDGIGDACETVLDSDQDGILDEEDCFPQIPNPLQTIVVVDTDSFTTEYNTIQAAINNAAAGDYIGVCSGDYPESIILDSKLGTLDAPIIIEGIGEPRVENFTLSRSRFITISGFDIDVPHQNGIRLEGAAQANENITIQNNKIHGAPNGFHGIRIDKNNLSVTLKNNEIYDNAKNGVWIKDNLHGPTFIQYNLIHHNGNNGIELKKTDNVVLLANEVSLNGIGKGSGKHHYGLLVGGPFQSGGPSIILTDNLFCSNNGRIISGSNSADLGGYYIYLDDDDSGNQTSCGCEGQGISGTCPAQDCNNNGIEDSIDISGNKSDFLYPEGRHCKALTNLVNNDHW